MNTTIQVRIDSKLKKDVSKIFESLGLDLSSGVKMFFNQVVVKKGIPFQALTENGYTQEQEAKLRRIIKETEELHKAGKLKVYDDWESAKKAILSE